MLTDKELKSFPHSQMPRPSFFRFVQVVAADLSFPGSPRKKLRVAPTRIFKSSSLVTVSVTIT